MMAVIEAQQRLQRLSRFLDTEEEALRTMCIRGLNLGEMTKCETENVRAEFMARIMRKKMKLIADIKSKMETIALETGGLRPPGLFASLDEQLSWELKLAEWDRIAKLQKEPVTRGMTSPLSPVPHIDPPDKTAAELENKDMKTLLLKVDELQKHVSKLTADLSEIKHKKIRMQT